MGIRTAVPSDDVEGVLGGFPSSILVIASYANSLVKFRGELLRKFVGHGIDVHVVAPKLFKDSSDWDDLVALGVQPHSIPLDRASVSPAGDVLFALRLVGLIRRVKPNAVLSYTIKPVVYGTIVAWLCRVPRRFVLITGLGYAFTGGRKGLLASVMRLMYRLSLLCAEKTFFQNPDDRNLFLQLRIMDSKMDSCVVAGSGVDVNEYSYCPLASIASVAPSFLMIARLLGDKGVREYVLAASEVKAVHPAVHFGLVGWIDENPDSIDPRELDSWVQSGVVTYLGKLDDVRSAISAFSVYVLPSYREGTPRTVLEAMAMGRPIITTDAPGCRETVVDGDNGFLVPVQSVDALVNAMLKFIGDPMLAQRMGRRSRQIAEDKYDVHKVNAVMLREMGISPADLPEGAICQ